MKKSYKMLLISGFLSIAIAGCKNNQVAEVDTTNPFFTAYNTPFDVPPFEKIMAKHYMPAFIKGMADGRVEIDSLAWAAVLDNDAFEAFKEKGIFDTTVATSYRKNILEKNGTMDAMKMFVNFRGREPIIEPLLKNRGLIKD